VEIDEAIKRIKNRKEWLHRNCDCEDCQADELAIHILENLTEKKLIDIMAVTDDLKSGERLEDFWERLAKAIIQSVTEIN
jgi:hypothetical protein